MDRDNNILYWVIGAVALALAVIGMITYSGEKRTVEASQKAQQLTVAFEQAGLVAPSEKVAIRTLGHDGGQVCEDPSSALARATLLDGLVNGGSQVGRRPLIVDNTVLKGEALIIQTYCPDELAEFKSHADSLKTDETIDD